MLNLREYQKKPRALSDYLPWAHLIAPSVILNKDGSFQTTVRYRGPDLDSSTKSEMVAVVARLNNALRRFGDGWCLFFEAERQPAINYPHSQFPDMASWLVDEERKATFSEDNQHYECAYYLTFQYLPPSEVAGKVESFIFITPEGEEDTPYKRHLERFIEKIDRTVDLLKLVFPEAEKLTSAEQLTYLHNTVSTKRHPISVPAVPVCLDAILSDTQLVGGLYPRLGEHYIQTLTIRGFPGSTVPGILDDLNDLGFPYRWVTRWIPLDKAQAEKTLAKIRRQWFAKRKSVYTVMKEVVMNEESAFVDTDATNKAADADSALEELGSDDVSYGYVTITVTLLHQDLRILDEMSASVERIINSRGFTTIKETLNAVEAWFGSLPGHAYANIRQPIISTLNLAHMMPVSAVWAGPQKNNHLKGPVLLMAKMKGSTPFRLDLHVGDVGHSLVVGPTGAGKSVFLSLLALQFRRYGWSQVFIFDKGRSARAASLAMGGQSYDLSLSGQSGLQPLANIDQDKDLSFAFDWLLILLDGEGIKITPSVKKDVWEALVSLASAPKDQRTLTGLSLLLRSDDIRAALQPFTIVGAYGALLDADKDTLTWSDVLHFEMEELLNYKKLVFPVLTYIFHKLEARFDGRPTLLILDEAWVFLDHPVFAERIREWLKTLRKKNVAVVFATQSLSDIANSSIAPAIIESCPTRIFLPNERAGEPQIHSIYEMFGLNLKQIQNITESIPKQDYYVQTARGNRLFELDLGPIALALCGSSSQDDHKMMDELLKKNPRSFLSEFFRAKELVWAAEIVERHTVERKAG